MDSFIISLVFIAPAIIIFAIALFILKKLFWRKWLNTWQGNRAEAIVISFFCFMFAGIFIVINAVAFVLANVYNFGEIGWVQVCPPFIFFPGPFEEIASLEGYNWNNQLLALAYIIGYPVLLTIVLGTLFHLPFVLAQRFLNRQAAHTPK